MVERETVVGVVDGIVVVAVDMLTVVEAVGSHVPVYNHCKLFMSGSSSR